MRRPDDNDDLYDVIVMGGGPAGSALATFLAREGYRSLIVESSTFPRYHIGESLIPHTFGTLDRLGLLPKLRASHFPEKHSVRFVSPSGKESDPFYFSETVEGEGARTWQVERSEFDQMCLDNARENGVEVRMATRVKEVLFEDGKAVGVRALSTEGDAYEIRARVVADASGRATLIGSQLGLKGPVPGLRMASLWTYFRGRKRGEGLDAGETTIFMIPGGGWFWYIPLPEDIVSIGIVADSDELFASSESPEEVFSSRAAACSPLAERLGEAVRTDQVRGIRHLAYRNRRIAGDGWVMVGDAAGFLDPIYSSGLFLALASAELAARSIDEALREEDLSAEKLGTFSRPLAEAMEVIGRLIHAFYDPEFSFTRFLKRFPEQRQALIQCLIGDVINRDMRSFLESLATMSAAPTCHSEEPAVEKSN